MSGEGETHEGGARIAEVLLPVAVDIAYSYHAPPALRLAPGDCVKVPLGARDAFGVVWAPADGARSNLKTVIARYDRPPLNDTLRGFVDWVARWTLAPRIGYRLAGPPPERVLCETLKVRALPAPSRPCLGVRRLPCADAP